jgi:hypothetical protein
VLRLEVVREYRRALGLGLRAQGGELFAALGDQLVVVDRIELEVFLNKPLCIGFSV